MPSDRLTKFIYETVTPGGLLTGLEQDWEVWLMVLEWMVGTMILWMILRMGLRTRTNEVLENGP